MKRFALLVVFLALAVGACGGGGDSAADGLAEAPKAPGSASEGELPPAPTAPAPSVNPEAADEPSPASAAPQGEEIGERRDIGSAPPPPPRAEGEPRQEDTSRPKAPILSGQTLDGEPVSLEDFLGTPVVVKVFAEH